MYGIDVPIMPLPINHDVVLPVFDISSPMSDSGE